MLVPTLTKQKNENGGTIDVVVDRELIPVYHPQYAPMHPSGAEPEELATLLASGWYLTPEAMALGIPQTAASDADRDVSAMVRDERAHERKDKKNSTRG